MFATKMSLGMTKDAQSFRNLSLSFRGSERQPPSILQMALRFSAIMDRQAANGMTGTTEARLKRVISEFNSSPGLHVKHQVDSDRERTILNLIVGSCKDCSSMFDYFYFRLVVILIFRLVCHAVYTARRPGST